MFYLRFYQPVCRCPAESAFELRSLREVPPTPSIEVARPIRTLDGADWSQIAFACMYRIVYMFRRACECRFSDRRPFAYDAIGISVKSFEPELAIRADAFSAVPVERTRTKPIGRRITFWPAVV